MVKRYRRRKSAASSIVGDTAYMASRSSWRGALLLGLISFLLLYYGVPAWLETKQPAAQANIGVHYFHQILSGRYTHLFHWLGITCGLIGIFFAIRNYFLQSQANYDEQRLVSKLAKLIARLID